jgi:hypothetical protein
MIVVGLMYVIPMCVCAFDENTTIKTLKPYPEYYEYSDKSWYLKGTGLTRVKKPMIKVIGIINKDNVDKYKDNLPESLHKIIKEWGLEMNVIPAEFKFKPSKGYIEATRKNVENGCIISKDNKLENYNGGDPFPDPKSALELMWSRFHRYIGDTMFVSFPGRVINRRGGSRDAGGYAQKLKIAHRTDIEPLPGVTPNPRGVDIKEVDSMNHPPEVKGSQMLLYRYLDAQQDDMWMYVPAMRRVRRFSVAQRCDAYAGSHATWDNFWIFNGKVQAFDFKLLGEKEMYLSAQQSICAPRRGSEEFNEWHDPRITTATGPNEALPGTLVPTSYDQPFKKVIGSVQNLLVSLRPYYIVEAKAHDPKYIYSKMVFYIDKEFKEMIYGEMWDRKGTLWKSTMYPYDVLPEVSPGQGSIAGIVIAWYIDHINEEGDYWDYDRAVRQNYPIDRKLFTPEGLRRSGH